MTHTRAPSPPERERATVAKLSPTHSHRTYPYSDGQYIYFVDPDAPTAASGHMPFEGHRTVREWNRAYGPKAKAA